MNKTNVRVYDVPVRLFHWIFVSLFSAAFFIAKVYDDDSNQYPYHMILGFILALVVILRIVWGFSSSRYARFSAFKLSPSELLIYGKNLFNKNGKVYLGHNPASSWAAVIMMFCSLGLAFTGYQMVNGQEEFFEDVHELFANLFVLSAIAHVAGIVFHTIRHKDPIGLSMLTGTKKSEEVTEGIENNHFIFGLVFLLLTGAFGLHLFKNYDEQTHTLKVFGGSYVLGENEEDEGGDESGSESEDEHDDD